jgi:hypothetical protein
MRTGIYGYRKAEIVRKLREPKADPKPYTPCPCVFCEAQRALIKREKKARVQ